MHATEALAEADRLMTICNSCRYCEGLCAVFPALERRREFADADLNYLANLCHGCGACYVDCQFAPPHEFAVNVPAALAKVRHDSYRLYTWPAALRPLFARNAMAVAVITSLSIAVFIAGLAAFNDAGALFAIHTGPGAFYRLMPHNAMALLFGAAFAYALVAIAFSARSFWNVAPPAKVTIGNILQGLRDAAHLRNLGGGGAGCALDEAKPDRRRLFHHLTSYGFGLCFLSTSIATLYHYVLSREAPYPWYDLPVVLGTIGGFGLVIGPLGLWHEKRKRGGDVLDRRSSGMDNAFIALLALTGASGLALLFLRHTGAMGLLLAFHLGVVLGLILTLPYSKMVHGLYRLMALIKDSAERQTHL